MDILVDTGILLRVFASADTRHPAVMRAVADCKVRGHRLLTGSQNFAEFWNVCTRPTTARGGLGLSFAETERRLGEIEVTFELIPELPATYPLWRNLVVIHKVQGKQVHDARLAALMLSHGVTHVLTLNAPDFARFPQVTVLDPTAAPPIP